MKLCIHKEAIKLVRYDEPAWFEGIKGDRVAFVTVTDVPTEDDSNNSVSMTVLALPRGYGWPCFRDRSRLFSGGRSIILRKDGIHYPDLSHIPRARRWHRCSLNTNHQHQLLFPPQTLVHSKHEKN
jgi:hypothetical protein